MTPDHTPQPTPDQPDEHARLAIAAILAFRAGREYEQSLASKPNRIKSLAAYILSYAFTLRNWLRRALGR